MSKRDVDFVDGYVVPFQRANRDLRNSWESCRHYDSFEAAITAIGATEAVLLVEETEAVADDVTIPATLTVEVIQGGRLSIASGKTVTINGHVEAGLYQIFSGAGTVKFSKGPIYAEWWGFSTAASAATNASAIQSAISSFIQAGGYGQPFGDRVLLGRGVFAVAPDVITFLGKSSITLEGSGISYGYDEAYYASTTLEFTSGTVGINVSDGASLTATAFNVIKNLKIDGNGVLANGIQISNAQLLKGVCVEGCTTAGLRITGATNSSHIDLCSFSYNTGGAGIYVSADGLAYTTAFTVSRTNLRVNRYGIRGEIGSGVSVDRCVIESNTGYGVYLNMPNTAAARGRLSQWEFKKVWIENNGTGGSEVYQIMIDTGIVNQDEDPPKSIRFRGCNISSGAVTRKYLNIVEGEDIEFDDSKFSGSTEATAHAFDATYATNISFKTNSISDGSPTDAQISGKDVRVLSYDTSVITDHGVTGSAADNTWMTLFTMAGSPGMYIVLAYLTTGAVANYYANARIAWDGTNALVMTTEDGTHLFIQISGANVQAKQTSGATQAEGISWKYMEIR